MKAKRSLLGMLLVALLAACAYAGAYRNEEIIRVSAVRTTYVIPESEATSVQGALERSRREKEEQIALLQSVIRDAAADQETKADALRQISEMAERNERESEILECLKGFGIDEAAVICGAHMLTVIASQKDLADNEIRTRVFDAVSQMAGVEAGDVKIIITKK